MSYYQLKSQNGSRGTVGNAELLLSNKNLNFADQDTSDSKMKTLGQIGGGALTRLRYQNLQMQQNRDDLQMMSRNSDHNHDAPYYDAKGKTTELSHNLLSPVNAGSKSAMRHHGLLSESLVINEPNKTLYKV